VSVGNRACPLGVVAAIVFVAIGDAGVAWSDGPPQDAGAEAAAPAATSRSSSDARPAASSCPVGMVDVEGDYCPDLPEQKCIKWVSTAGLRCAEFAKSEGCAAPTLRKHFCMDRFEYPNVSGDNPLVMKNWYEARSLCTSSGKRLCNESEWTLACEGPDRLAYPYGLVRDATACNIDKPPINPHDADLLRVDKRDAEAKRLWQGEPSGARARCISDFGVQDLTGNVDEWVVNEKGKPHQSALKGGYWSWVRGRCRPVTDGHAEDFRYYQIGFRCCADPAAAIASSVAASRRH